MTDIEEYEAALLTLRKVQNHVAELAKINDPFGKSPALIEAFEKVINHMHSTVFEIVTGFCEKNTETSKEIERAEGDQSWQ